MYDINIVADINTINYFKKITNFKMDLGKNFVDAKTKQYSISDNFVAYMLNSTNINVNKIGKAGSINFYYIHDIPQFETHIYFDDKKHTRHLTAESILDINKWLSVELLEINNTLEQSDTI